MTAQLELFAPTAQPLAFVTICPRCGELLDTFEVADAGEPWNEAALWSYVAQYRHEQEVHA